MKMINPAVWFEIYVENLERAQKFYEQVLDLKLSKLPTPGNDNGDIKMLSFPMAMDGEGASGALVEMKGVCAGGNSTLIYFGSKECSIEESRIETAGGKIFKSKEAIGEYGFMCLGYDTEGNMFGIHSEK